jgi:phosphoribosylanthranilate isomerase
MAEIKICGLSRTEDIEYANEARPHYIGFVFAESRRKITPEKAVQLRSLLDSGIIPVGVFVNAPIENIAALYRDGIIDIAQLHGDEDAAYIARLKEATAADKRGAVRVIGRVRNEELGVRSGFAALSGNAALGAADYYLLDNGSGGTGKTFDWEPIKRMKDKPDPSRIIPPCSEPFVRLLPANYSLYWFLAGGIGLHNIHEALLLGSFGIDISSGAETDGVKDRGKMIELTSIVRKGKGL